MIKNRKITILLSIVLILVLLAGCNTQENQKNTAYSDTIILATTTSTRDSGLLDYLLPKFEDETGIKVKVIAVGTGKALQMGRDGEADVLLVHAKPDEEQFVKEGHGLERHDVMYNDFILVGPKGLKVEFMDKSNDIVAAFKAIAENKYKFISRGDNSGTHKKELKIWKETGIQPGGAWYISAGSGMGYVLKMADEMRGITLTDRATYLNLRDKIDLSILVEKDSKLFNQYGIILVNPNKKDNINLEGAQKFMNWLLSDKAQKLIGEYGKDKFGMPLFVPNGRK
ncbi:tungsten ABC transporter substrate-binding protein [Caloranaerobacter sp. TR13]|uniref:extracellular solute-binding protein n=1 Tax=Caloranaerobacter sp. TR13 TaxID=1302151 RepID=UPI0006D44CE0|nr:extracellular solute-binding protein [Caloranaerobacter sp. TR13]KPU26719.1 tungsten ABC transporter substrate-binding protein [Caloranaerobacter sp. TR13]